jgi:hypothetical protein
MRNRIKSGLPLSTKVIVSVQKSLGLVCSKSRAPPMLLTTELTSSAYVDSIIGIVSGACGQTGDLLRFRLNLSDGFNQGRPLREPTHLLAVFP